MNKYEEKLKREYEKTNNVLYGLVGTLVIGGAIGTGLIINHCKQEMNKPPIVYTKEDDKEFEIGEHIVLVPLEEDPRYEVKEYEPHIGYKPVGISSSAYGRDNNLYGDGYIMYVNTEEVIAHPTETDKDGNLIYKDFGYPINYVTSDETVYTIEYQPGEHIVSIPFSEYQQYDLYFTSYDGYEPVGLATTGYGKDGFHEGGGCILYTNTETVEKDKDSTEVFGKPIEEVKVKQKDK